MSGAGGDGCGRGASGCGHCFAKDTRVALGGDAAEEGFGRVKFLPLAFSLQC